MAYTPPNPNGQATMANSSPVVLASDQSAVPISATSLPLPTGGSTSALQTTGNTSVGSIDTKTPALGQALAAASVPIVLTAAQVTTLTPPANTGYALDASITTTNTEIGIVTETAPATDTASSGLNGRLQRVAQRLTSLIALLPTALGAGGGLKVDGSGTALPVSGTVTTSPPANASTNIAQINGVTPLMGNGITGTGSQRVTIASDNTPFPVKTDQTTHGTTDLVAADITKFGGTATSLGQKVMASSMPVVLSSDQATIPVTLTSTTLTGTSTVAGGKTNNNAAPGATNVGALPAIANAVAPVWTEGNQVAESVDLSGNQRVIQVDQIVAATAITATNLNLFSGTATANSTVASATLNGMATGAFQVSGVYAGLLVPQGTTDGTNWVTMNGIRKIGSSSILSAITNGDTGIYRCNIAGFTKWRVSASSLLSGTATVTLEANPGPAALAVMTNVLLDPTTAPSVTPRDSQTMASIINTVENNLLEQVLVELRALNGGLGITALDSNPNAYRRLDNTFSEVVTVNNERSRIKTATITLSASVVETTLIPADLNNFIDILAIKITNTSAATSSRVDIRDSTGGIVIDQYQSIGGGAPVGMSLGGVAIPQTQKGQNWTAQCITSTTDIRILVIYSLKAN